MRFLSLNEMSFVDNALVIEHRGNELVFPIKTYRNLKATDNFIIDINKYWARLPIEAQDKIYYIYAQISDAFEMIGDTRKLDAKLVELVGELFEYHRFEDVYEYYEKYSRIKLPANLKTKYIVGDDTKELTYLHDEYKELIALSIALKIMVPIWGVYISSIAEEAGTNIKEYRAARLLRNAQIIHCDAYKRLYLYVSTYWNDNPNKSLSSAILAGLDDSQIPDWLMSNVLIRRICTNPFVQLDQPEEAQIMITAVYNYIEHLSTTLDKQFGGRVNEKGLENASSTDDDNTSVLENYKIKQDISDGVIAIHEMHLLHHLPSIVTALDETMDINSLNHYITLFKENYSEFKFNQLSSRLVRWVLHPVVNAHILDYVGYDALMNAHHAAYALLKHWRYDALAALVYAQPENTEYAMYIVRQPITQEQFDKLQELYPYAPNNTLKRKLSKYDSNVAVIDIRDTVSSAMGVWWRIPKWEDVKDTSVKSINGLIPMYASIEIMLADLVIFLKTKIHTAENLNRRRRQHEPQ